MRKTIIYDCEIKNCIPSNDDNGDFSFQYCSGWKDFAGMGISVIVSYSYWDDLFHIFLEDNLDEFQKLVDEAEEIVGFNSLSFDDKLCATNHLNVNTTYDLLCEVRVASGQPPYYDPRLTRGGYSLNNLCFANLGIQKSGTGAEAPKLYQQGQHGKLISYCLRDVQLTRKIFELALRGDLRDPITSEILVMKSMQ